MWELYLTTTLGNISTVSCVITVLSLLGCMVALVIKYDIADNEESIKLSHKWAKISLVVFGISLFLAIFTPSKKEMYIMFGLGSTIDYIQESDKVKELPDKTVTLINQTLDKLIEEGKES